MNRKSIRSLIKNLLAGSSIKEDEEKINQHFLESFYADEWDERKLGVKKEVKQRMLSAVNQRVNQSAPSFPKRFAFKRYIGHAAVFALVVCAGLLGRVYLVGNDDVIAVSNSGEALAPGSTKAVLELSSGSTLSLMDLDVGENYADAGVVLKKTEEGSLEYKYVVDDKGAQKEVGWNTLKTPIGGKYQIVLADGTKVWLNAGSSLTFPDYFTGDERLVKASGEVYFEVSHNKEKPFIVSTGELDIQVVGTAFNLSAYEDNAAGPSVVLIEGAVKLKTEAGSFALSPGQKGTVNKGEVQIVAFDEESELAWKDDYFVFKNQNIKEIMRSLARWYDAEVIYEGNGWEDRNFTVRMSRREGIEEILSIIELTRSIKFKTEGRRVIVSK